MHVHLSSPKCPSVDVAWKLGGVASSGVVRHLTMVRNFEVHHLKPSTITEQSQRFGFLRNHSILSQIMQADYEACQETKNYFVLRKRRDNIVQPLRTWMVMSPELQCYNCIEKR
ncbi:hypothetical protein TNCV_4949921 [Trichonephila clavipes]|nr:hypothetical protein TNCV_4949921 [Trichonephila clavipes]